MRTLFRFTLLLLVILGAGVAIGYLPGFKPAFNAVVNRMDSNKTRVVKNVDEEVFTAKKRSPM